MNFASDIPHEVFISFATNDKPFAEVVCAKLESRNIRCWMAPRDVPPGEDFPQDVSRPAT